MCSGRSKFPLYRTASNRKSESHLEYAKQNVLFNCCHGNLFVKDITYFTYILIQHFYVQKQRTFVFCKNCAPFYHFFRHFSLLCSHVILLLLYIKQRINKLHCVNYHHVTMSRRITQLVPRILDSKSKIWFLWWIAQS